MPKKKVTFPARIRLNPSEIELRRYKNNIHPYNLYQLHTVSLNENKQISPLNSKKIAVKYFSIVLLLK